MASFESVQKFATEILSKHSGDAIHILINNAGVMFIPEERTKDGNEKQIQVNHLGHFLLAKLLMPKLLKAKPARIINISSLAHTWSKYTPSQNVWSGSKSVVTFGMNKRACST